MNFFFSCVCISSLINVDTLLVKNTDCKSQLEVMNEVKSARFTIN